MGPHTPEGRERRRRHQRLLSLNVSGTDQPRKTSTGVTTLVLSKVSIRCLDGEVRRRGPEPCTGCNGLFSP